MRLVDIEPHPRPNKGPDLFTFECACGELHTSPTRLQELANGLFEIEFIVHTVMTSRLDELCAPSVRSGETGVCGDAHQQRYEAVVA